MLTETQIKDYAWRLMKASYVASGHDKLVMDDHGDKFYKERSENYVNIIRNFVNLLDEDQITLVPYTTAADDYSDLA